MFESPMTARRPPVPLAPSARAAADVHRTAHGLVADQIFQVQEGS
jgi:hypothetical protein